eukprot:COSAG05_NODE_9560_length_616_cov_0.829787_1_plen_193_part_10
MAFLIHCSRYIHLKFALYCTQFLLNTCACVVFATICSLHQAEKELLQSEARARQLMEDDQEIRTAHDLCTAHNTALTTQLARTQQLYDEMRQGLEDEIEWRYQEQTETHCELHETLDVLAETCLRCEHAQQVAEVSHGEAKQKCEALKKLAESSVRAAEEQRQRADELAAKCNQAEVELLQVKSRAETIMKEN